MDWNNLESQVYTLSKKAFFNLLNDHLDERFYAFAMYTDSSAMTICLAANSLEKLNEKIDEEDEEDEEDKTDEAISYFKWTTSEWAYEAFEGDAFAEINRALRNDKERNEFNTFSENLITSMTNVLALLVNEDFFKKKPIIDGAVVFVTITDDDAAQSIENISAKLLNTEDTSQTFLKRFDF
ncbi:hypothetical protein ALP73_00785 [Pseudomonas coronafaciens pv. garcae]|uniref:DUF4303 domain-containing protein n=2 Tax=Pseudomonas syringae group TaxID=136849 RepID=A0AB37QGM9_9PSED|nr:DUF4303 domain-containing protein [Pseudomonas coronafaciens]RMR93544.1 hypothetical protein ALP74_200226 [Pseudomonas coronafaciens pv. garcae]RMS05858.1 hypothetical protein ALP73_00785 [Pseudomonas coronafaciens pv. garcae]